MMIKLRKESNSRDRAIAMKRNLSERESSLAVAITVELNTLVDTASDDGDLGSLVLQHGDYLCPNLLLELLRIGAGSQSSGFTATWLVETQPVKHKGVSLTQGIPHCASTFPVTQRPEEWH